MYPIQGELFSATAAAASLVTTAYQATYKDSDVSLLMVPATESKHSFRLALSGILGSISIACWVVLLVPQLIDQWRMKSSEGVSLLFLAAWLLGDVANLLGAVWAHLLRNVVVLAIWFVFADTLELSSALYYRFFHEISNWSKSRQRVHSDEDPNCPVDEDEADLTSDNLPLLSDNVATSDRPILDGIGSDDAATSQKAPNKWLHYGVPIIAVCLAGVIGYMFSSDDANDVNNAEDANESGKDSLALGPQILGYMSALFYLSARIPQIIKNYRKRSVHGLSLLFFIYSTMGNVTYAFQIILYSSERNYILLNFPWLLGSLGTVLQDAIIFAQFYMYRERSKTIGTSQMLSEINNAAL
ncbi:PQ loop repeat-domain-containing protein [Lipomyces kononenkoae]